MDATSFLANFSTIADAPGGVLRLRELVLELAVRGRLVASDPGHTAIAPPGANPNGPFRIPSHWRWVSFSEVAESRLGKMLDKAKNTGPFRPYLRNANVQWFRFDLSDVHELRLEDDDLEAHTVRIGDLIICEGGEPGRLAICDESVEGMVVQKALHRARPKPGVDAWYLAYVIKTYAGNGFLMTFFTGATIKHLTGKALATLPVPLPPLAEQQRIVAKVVELMGLCDELEACLELQHSAAAELAAATCSSMVAHLSD